MVGKLAGSKVFLRADETAGSWAENLAVHSVETTAECWAAQMVALKAVSRERNSVGRKALT